MTISSVFSICLIFHPIFILAQTPVSPCAKRVMCYITNKKNDLSMCQILVGWDLEVGKSLDDVVASPKYHVKKGEYGMKWNYLLPETTALIKNNQGRGTITLRRITIKHQVQDYEVRYGVWDHYIHNGEFDGIVLHFTDIMHQDFEAVVSYFHKIIGAHNKPIMIELSVDDSYRRALFEKSNITKIISGVIVSTVQFNMDSTVKEPLLPTSLQSPGNFASLEAISKKWRGYTEIEVFFYLNVYPVAFEILKNLSFRPKIMTFDEMQEKEQACKGFFGPKGKHSSLSDTFSLDCSKNVYIYDTLETLRRKLQRITSEFHLALSTEGLFYADNSKEMQELIKTTSCDYRRVYGVLEKTIET